VEVAATIEGFSPHTVSGAAGAFAKELTAQAKPESPNRAKAYLFAASRLGAFCESIGLALTATVALHPSVIERCCAPGMTTMSQPTRRTVRSNLRAIARALSCGPPPLLLTREHAKLPYTAAEIARYLALADAQPTQSRRMRAGALVCLSAGAGLVGADLKARQRLRRGPALRRGGRHRCRRPPAPGGAGPRPLRRTAPRRCPVGGRPPLDRGHIVSASQRDHPAHHVVVRRAGSPTAPDRPPAGDVAVRGRRPDRPSGIHGRSGDYLLSAPRGPRGRAAELWGRKSRRAVGGKALSAARDLGRLEVLVDASGAAPEIEASLPVGVRPRQLCVRTLLLGILLCQAEGRPAHLTRVHGALLALDNDDRCRLGVAVDWRRGAHVLTYRQVERTFSLVVGVLGREHPDGTPTEALQERCDSLLEASVAAARSGDVPSSSSLAVDWTDVESFSDHRTKPSGTASDKEAAWGHRKGGGPGEKAQLFFGYYLSLATTVGEAGRGEVPELVRRMNLVSCDHDPVPPMVHVLTSMAAAGIPLGDVICDSGYAHRVPEHFALPLRAVGASLVMDLHPSDRGTQGTFQGAISCNGNLYCPMTPSALFGLSPPARGASPQEVAAHDERAGELARFKLGRISSPDADGHHRVGCPALSGKVRCSLREASMSLSLERPEVLTPPEHPPACCTQQTITVPPSVNAKTAQRHDYAGAAWRRSYARRSAAERSNARIKDPATIDVAKGWCRTMGLTPMTLFLVCALAVRNLAVADAFEQRRADDERRTAAGLPPRTRRRRRRTLADLVGASANAPP